MQPRFNLCSKHAKGDWRSSYEYQPSDAHRSGGEAFRFYLARFRFTPALDGLCSVYVFPVHEDMGTRERENVLVAPVIRIPSLPSKERINGTMICQT
jgi:hypothetical protein